MIKRWSQHIAEQSILEGEIKKALVMLVKAQSKNDLKPLFQF
jgi:hypothetical protein